MSLDRLLTLEEAAEICRRPVATLRFWRASGTGPPCARIGGRVMFREGDLAAWLDEQFAAEQRSPKASA